MPCPVHDVVGNSGVAWINVVKEDNRHLSRFEIARANRIYQHHSGSRIPGLFDGTRAHNEDIH
jgi:hypothetical protein